MPTSEPSAPSKDCATATAISKSSKKAIPAAVASCDSSSCSDRALARALTVAFQSVLLILALFQVAQHYGPLHPITASFGLISHITGWNDVFHVAFVIAFFVRTIAVSLGIAMRKRLQSKSEEGGKVWSYLLTMIFFFLVLFCWMASLPIFKDCRSEGDAAMSSQLCFFAESSSKKGVFRISGPKYSLLDILARMLYKTTNAFLKSKIKGRLMWELRRGLWRPLAFRGRLKKLFLVLRYAKFFGPLVGTCNKFRGHIFDMIKKRRQRIASQRAQKLWNELLDALSKKSKLERAVLNIQRRFRERREGKVKRRFALMSPHRDTSNRKMAHNIRKRLAEEQHLSRSKLRKMDELDAQRQLKRLVSQDERKNITRHKESERRLKKRLLLSPNTSIAVSWKYLTIACVALEISQIVMAPMLSGEMKKMPLDEFLLRILNASSKNLASSAAPSIFVPVINGNLSSSISRMASSSWEQVWIPTVRILATALVPIVKAIFFLDVFVTFFTGELTSSGKLVAKPFFARYILPGVGLQLIVNPTMVQISRFAKGIFVGAARVGPSLCFHLFLVCIPVATYCYDYVLDMIFDFVEMQNRKIVAK